MVVGFIDQKGSPGGAQPEEMKMDIRKDEIGIASEIRPHELTAVEMDTVNGGLRNNQTAWWHAVTRGIEVGMIMGGATVVCTP